MIAAGLLLCLLIVFYLNGVITDYPIEKDAADNLRMAHNIYRYGVVSVETDAGSRPAPDNYREPLPPLVTAAFIALHPGIKDDVTESNLLNGKYTPAVKQVNLAWSFLLLAATGLLAFSVTGNIALSYSAVILSAALFLRAGAYYIDNLITEVPTAALMVLACFFLVSSMRSAKAGVLLASGFTVGLLALTKAAFIYIAGVVFFLILLHAFLVYRDRTFGFKIMRTALFVMALVVAVLPWLAHNKVHLDTYSLTQRGGMVLLLRSYKNQMNSAEYRASFHKWGPELYRFLAEGTRFDVVPAEYGPGGKAARLNRELPGAGSSFYWMAITHREKTIRAFEEAGYRDPGLAADRYLQNVALARIAGDPGRHLLTTVPVFWRGLWSFPVLYTPSENTGGLAGRQVLNYMINIINLLCVSSLVLLFFSSLGRLKWAYLALTVPAVSLIGFHALATHNLARYNVPVVPIMLICFIVILQGCYNILWEKNS